MSCVSAVWYFIYYWKHFDHYNHEIFIQIHLYLCMPFSLCHVIIDVYINLSINLIFQCVDPSSIGWITVIWTKSILVFSIIVACLKCAENVQKVQKLKSGFFLHREVFGAPQRSFSLPQRKITCTQFIKIESRKSN